MANLFSGFIDRYRSWRYGGVTGLNYFEQNTRMTALITGSWLGGYLLCFMFAPDPYLEISIILMSIMWMFGCAFVYLYAKNDATNFRCFAQSSWSFPDGGKRKYDLMISPEDGFSKECDIENEEGKKIGEGWRINFEKRLQYWDKRSDFPFVFDYALCKFPKPPDTCFQYLSLGEVFHKGIAIKTPSENISVYVFGWVQDAKGMYVPVCAINDCSLAYSKALEEGEIRFDDFKLKEKEGKELVFRHERSRRMMLERHTTVLEDMVNTELVESKQYRKEVWKGVDTVRELYKTVMDTEKPLIQRIKANLWKIALIVIGAVALLWFMGWI